MLAIKEAEIFLKMKNTPKKVLLPKNDPITETSTLEIFVNNSDCVKSANTSTHTNLDYQEISMAS